MRLICPNCGAQYEVPDEVIPTNGRDVQCSNCGDTWFQQHPTHAPAASNDDELGPEPQAFGAPQPAPATESEVVEDVEVDIYDDDEDDLPQEVPAPPTSRPVRRTVDPGVADILRQEAEHERQVRAAAGGIETQPDLGLTEPDISEDERTRQARSRMERLRGAPGPSVPAPPEIPDTHAGIDPSSRRNLLPDIEEINSSLTSSGDRSDTAVTPIPEEIEMPVRSGGFRSGFRLAVVTFALATLVYALAPRIIGIFPGAEAPLAQYVEAVNTARIWLDDLIGTASAWFSDMSAPSGSGDS